KFADADDTANPAFIDWLVAADRMADTNLAQLPDERCLLCHRQRQVDSRSIAPGVQHQRHAFSRHLRVNGGQPVAGPTQVWISAAGRNRARSLVQDHDASVRKVEIKQPANKTVWSEDADDLGSSSGSVRC